MKAGVPITYTIDLSSVPSFSKVKFETYSFYNKKVVYTSEYPKNGDVPEITKEGDVYTSVIPSTFTSSMRGSYGVEITFYDPNGAVIDITEESKTGLKSSYNIDQQAV